MSGKPKRPSMANAVGNVAVMAQTNAGTDARMVQVSTISVIPRHNPRYSRMEETPELTEDDLTDILPSIRDQGVLSPLLLRPNPHAAPGHYELVAGHRRLRAAILAGITQVPVYIREIPDRDLLKVAITENNARQKPDPYNNDLAVLEQISATTGVPLEQIPSYLNRLRNGTEEDVHHVGETLASMGLGALETWARTRSRILMLSQEEVAAVRAGQLSLKASLQLTYLKDNPQRAQILRQAAEGAWSAEQVRAHVQTLTKPSRSASRPSLDDLKSRLTPEKLEDLNDVKRQQVERQLAKLIALLDS